MSDFKAIPLTADEYFKFDEVATEIRSMAEENAPKRPLLTTLMEEVAEAILASRGKHDDPLELELMQIASVCINLIWQMRMDVNIANLQSERRINDRQS